MTHAKNVCHRETSPLTHLKDSIRRLKIAEREALSSDERLAKSEAIVRHILASEAFRAAKTVMLYRGVKGEVRLDLLPLLAPGKRYAYPLCAEGGVMRALIPEGGDAFRPGPFGIPEPDPTRSEEVRPEELDFVICPCTAFDGGHRRLGMGGGYYDRFLPKCTHATVIAAAFDCQRADELPEEPFDIRMDSVVTEEGRI